MCKTAAPVRKLCDGGCFITKSVIGDGFGSNDILQGGKHFC